MSAYVTWSLYIVLLAVLIYRLNAGSPDNLNVQLECHSNKTAMICTNRSLTEFPTIPDSVLFLDVSGNRIQTIPELGTSKLSKLEVLNTSKNAINTIAPNAFKDMTNLEILDISENNLTGDYITIDTFEGLSAVETLILRGNPLISLTEDAFYFAVLRDLRHLDVSYCRLREIHKFAWADLRKTESITLRGNNLENIDTIFSGPGTLVNLDISDNGIGEIGKKAFYGLGMLKTLRLKNCTLTSLHDDAFKGLENLHSLNLADNKFSKIPATAFSQIDALAHLDLSGNPLQAITFSSVEGSLKIESIRLDNVLGFYQLEPNTFGNIAGLRSVYIQNNKRFWKMDENTFGEARWNITRLHLSSNALETLPQNLVAWEHVQDLKLDGNSWDCDCNMKWIHDVTISNGRKIKLSCSNPVEHRGKYLEDIDPETLTCRRRDTRMIVGAVAAAAITLLLLGVIVLYRKNLCYRLWFRKMLCCGCACSTCCAAQYGRDKSGRYVSVFSKDADADEPITTILCKEDKIELTNAVDV